jgi:leader peptidase (prepilin peptidase)/N-methyltransferase
VGTGALDGLTIGLTILIAAAAGLTLARSPRLWLNDSEHLERWAASRFARGPMPVICGIVLAAAVTAMLASLVLSPGPEWTTAAPSGDFAASAPSLPEPNSADRIVFALFLGLVSAATPFLITADVLVRRLPDRIVFPLSAAGLILIIVGSVLGTSTMWFAAFFSGLGALAFFAALHLIGRVLRMRTMGLGDVKLAFIVFAVAGLFGPWAPALVLVMMMLIAGVWALVGAVRARRIRGVTIAFGPAMLSGMWLGSVLAPIVL